MENELIKLIKNPSRKTTGWDWRAREKKFHWGHKDGPFDHPDWKSEGPLSWEDATKDRPLPKKQLQKLAPIFIPQELYNKQFRIGPDTEMFIAYRDQFEPDDPEERGRFEGYGCRSVRCSRNKEWNIIAKYRGVYFKLAAFKLSIDYEMNECKPTQTNYHWLSPTEEKPYVMRHIIYRNDHDYQEGIKEFIEALNPEELELQDNPLDFQSWYSGYGDDKPKSLSEYSQEEIEIERIILEDTKDGLYKPSGFAANTLSHYFGDQGGLLRKLGIHTVHLRGTCHFGISSRFDLEGIKVKAPKKIIEKYGLEKYCADDKVVETLKREQEERDRKSANKRRNNKFTLMQHGKVVMENQDKEKIISYLESFYPSTEDVPSGKDMLEKEFVDAFKPLFDEYPEVNSYNICYWGRYPNAELAGERCNVNYATQNEGFTREMEEEFYEVASEVGVTDGELEGRYGVPDKHGNQLIIQRNPNGKLTLVVEYYDLTL